MTKLGRSDCAQKNFNDNFWNLNIGKQGHFKIFSTNYYTYI